MLFYHNRPARVRRSQLFAIQYDGAFSGLLCKQYIHGFVFNMTLRCGKYWLVAALVLVALGTSSPAHAFRCGNKIVVEDMHEAQVRAACGDPATVRHLGHALRGIQIPVRRTLSPGWTIEHYPGYGYYTQEVVLTEYVYNFGPRKLMRRLIFEGGVLVSIETIGYGYREKKKP